MWALAEQYRRMRFCVPAITYYEWYFGLKPDAVIGFGGYAECLLAQGRPEAARPAALRWLERGGSLTSARRILQASRRMSDTLNARGRPDTLRKLPAPAGTLEEAAAGLP